MDRSWMSLRDKFYLEYIASVTSFMNMTSNHTREDGKACCPYRRCMNLFWCILLDIQNHLYECDINMTHKRWTCHGEDLPTNSSILPRRPTNAMSVGGSPTHERQTLDAEDRKLLEDLHSELFEANVEAGSEHQHPVLRQEVEDDINIPVHDRFERLLRDA